MKWRRRRHSGAAPDPEAFDTTPLGSITRAPADYTTYQSTPPAVSGSGQGYVLAAASLVGSRGVYEGPQTQAWQNEAWDFFDCVPELSFAGRRMGNALSRIRLYVGVRDSNGEGRPDPIPDDPADPEQGTEDTRSADRRAREPLDELFGGQHGPMLARLGTHLTIPGDSYVCGYTENSERHWYVASSSELSPFPGTATTPGGADLIRDGQGGKVRIIQGEGMVLRLWRPHPRYGWQADSSVRALRRNLRELSLISAHIGASLESRLAGAGLLVIPQSATVPNSKRRSKSDGMDPITAAVIDAMMTPLKKPESVAALVPLIMRVRDDVADKIKHLKFSTPLDERVLELRQSALRQLAIGLDMPPEVMLGLGESSNHWNAWLISEDEIKLTISPICEVICAALTEKYLWPRLKQLGITDVTRYVVYYDVSELTQRPNRAPDAQTLYNMGLLGGTSTRRESGFTDDDKPSDEEALRHLIVSLMTSNISFDVAYPWLQLLKIDTGAVSLGQGGNPVEPGDGTPVDTSGGSGGDEAQQPAPAGTPSNPGPPDTPGNPANPVQPGPPPAAVAAAAGPPPLSALALVGSARDQPR